MAARKRKGRKKKSGKKRVRGASGRYQKKKAPKHKGKIPLQVLEKRLRKLNNIVEKRGGDSCIDIS